MHLAFVGVGPQRAGTTWLHENAVQHQAICVPPVKETFFFDRSFERGWEYYEAFFPSERRDVAEVVGEFGPSYFDAVRAPARIRSVNPACKIIVSVRNPIERAYSLFIHMASYGEVPADFERAVRRAPQILDSGHYRTHLERWLREFPREQMHFVVLDDIERQPQRVLDELYGFLQVSRRADSPSVHARVNAARLGRFPGLRRFKASVWHGLSTRHHYRTLRFMSKLWRLGPGRFERVRPAEQWPQLTLEQRRNLYGYYEEDIRFMESLLDRSFADWRVLPSEAGLGMQV